jgi:hypothetical protein
MHDLILPGDISMSPLAQGTRGLATRAAWFSSRAVISHKLLESTDFYARSRPVPLFCEKFIDSPRAKLTGPEAAAHNSCSPYRMIPKKVADISDKIMRQSRNLELSRDSIPSDFASGQMRGKQWRITQSS